MALSVNGGATWHDIGQALAFVDQDPVKVTGERLSLFAVSA